MAEEKTCMIIHKIKEENVPLRLKEREGLNMVKNILKKFNDEETCKFEDETEEELRMER